MGNAYIAPDNQENSPNIESMLILPQELTRTLAVRDLAGPLVDRTLRATSAAACSACLNVVQ